MFVLPGLALLVWVVYMRPQDAFWWLQSVPLLQLGAGLTLVGLLIDLRRGHARLEAGPQLLLVLAFIVWGAITVLVRLPPPQALPPVISVSFAIVLFVGISQGVTTFRALEGLMALVLALGLFLCVVGIHQGFAPRGCHQVIPEEPERGIYDGRSCETRLDCTGGFDSGADWMCEHMGLFGTHSIGGRVRYLGTIQDPNELSLVIVAVLPLAFAFAARRRSRRATIVATLAFALVATCTVLTRSRGGILVFIATLALWFLPRIGLRGIVALAVLGAPFLLLGGRSDAGAEQSSSQRLEAWVEGARMLVHNPVTGVGLEQFTQHHWLTAHNSYVLVMAELGLPGLFLWLAVCLLSVKILLLLPRALVDADERADVARIWCHALRASLGGLAIGIFFLSFAYHHVLWLFLGLSAALWNVTRTHVPRLTLRLGAIDLGALIIATAATSVGITLLARLLR